MSFTSVWAGLAALLLIPAIVLLHWLHRQQRQQVVPSTYLWQRLSQRLVHRTYWRRLLTSPLFWLQILAAVFLALALSDPHWHSRATPLPPVWQVILDESASMRAVGENGQTRFALAQRVLDQLSRDAPPQVRWQILTASPQPQALGDDLDPRKPSTRALWAGRQPAHGPADWQATIRLARALRPPRTQQVVLVTDGALDNSIVSELDTPSAPVIVHLARQGADRPNVGITRFDLTPLGESVSQYQALVTLFNTGPGTASYTLDWKVNGAPLRSAPPQQGLIPPGREVSLLVRLALLPGQVVEAHLSPADALNDDNQAFRVTLPLRRAKILLVTPGNPALAHGLSIFPGVQVVTMTPPGAPGTSRRPFPLPDWDDYDLAIFDRIPPPSLPPLPWIAWGLPAAALEQALPPLQAHFWAQWLSHHPESSTPVIAPTTLDWDEDHPLSQYVSWDEIHVRSAWPLPTLLGGLPLWESAGGPLVQLGPERPGYLIIAFDLTQTDWPLQYSFPVWLKNLLDWSLPWAAEAVGPSLHTGEPLPLRSLPARLFPPAGVTDVPFRSAHLPPVSHRPYVQPTIPLRTLLSPAVPPAQAASREGTARPLIIVGPDGYREPFERSAPPSAGAAGTTALWSAPLTAPYGGYWLEQAGQVVAGWSINLLSQEESDLRLRLTTLTTAAAPRAASPPPPLPRGANSRPLQLPAVVILTLVLLAEALLFVWESRPVSPRQPLPSSRWSTRKGGAG
ncbi:MAG: BatA and WFA domain-containing protein [Limnochordaceae bacterium]|nr:BatA and WFA domain-containing protein [Limnochordaceae bacterium]